MTDVVAVEPVVAGIEIASPARALAAIPVPVGELFAVAAEHERTGRLADAERLLGHILAAAPDQADALHLLGIVAYRLGRRSEALKLMRRSLVGCGGAALYWRNICEVLRVEGHLDEALAAGRRAAALNPDDAVALANLAIIHAERREIEDAERCERAALALDPTHAGAHFGLAELLLLKGDWAQGWEEYTWRFRLPGAAANLPPGGGLAWDGRPLAPKRLLVIADQGYGDAVQFCRYLPQVLERCPDPVVACERSLQSMMRQLGATTLVEHWNAVGAVDAIATLSGLPRVFGTRVETIPAPVPYLRADPERRQRWALRLAALTPPGMLKVGLVWAGRPTHANDHRRTASLAALAPLFAVPRIVFVSLQKGERQADVASYSGAAPMVNLGPELATWDDTLAVLAELDVIVSVDTAVAHLAGASGRPTQLMLPCAGEWRWLLERDDSPWYPTVRLHRQPTPGDWASVAGSVAPVLVDRRDNRQA